MMKTNASDLGICVWGIMYTCGLLDRGTPRANPHPITYSNLLDLAARLGVSTVELPPSNMAFGADAPTAEALGQRAAAMNLRLVVSGWLLSAEGTRKDMEFARKVGADITRVTLSTILCGDRSPVGGLDGWRELLAQSAATLKELAPVAADLNMKIAVENHQDATSADLLWLCEQINSPQVGITFDVGNALSVGEDCMAFCRAVLPHLFNVHLKDYRMFGTPTGFRLVRCPAGSGVVDFPAIFEVLRGRPDIARSIELAALGERHIRILEPQYWAGLPPRQIHELLPVLRLWREREESGQWRTPWEANEPIDMAQWELAQLEQSVRQLSPMVACECSYETTQ